jgi:4-hydroxythreonine-4-phosphate dehydrogenase
LSNIDCDRIFELNESGTPKIRIAITLGEPAGIGPDIALALATRLWDAELIIIGSPSLLQERAKQLGVRVKLKQYDPSITSCSSPLGELCVSAVELKHATITGKPDASNAYSVLNTLDKACDGCLNGEFDAMVTGPIQKSVINNAGIRFSGHTEYLAERSGGQMPVMMLADNRGILRVALATTHLALRLVPDAITRDRLIDVCRVIHHDLRFRFGIDNPRIAILGLNPHAGENGYMGREEIEIIQPAIETLRAEGLRLSDALPADTAFTQSSLKNFDAVLAMYHDQGLPVIKHSGFGNIVNVTLGLPIVRTSVDHGTALDLAGTGKASPESLFCAINAAIKIGCHNKKSLNISK